MNAAPWIAGAAAGAVALASQTVSAQVVDVSGVVAASAERTGANFSASVEYAHMGGMAGRLTIDLTNDSMASVGGFLTAIAFRAIPTDSTVDITLASADPSVFLDTGAVRGGGFGEFDGGAGLWGAFLGGGSPRAGLGTGESGRFVFDITTPNAALLSTESFIGTVDEPGLLIRFRGLNDNLSDMVPVPAPASLALFGLGGLMATRRRR